MIPILITGSNLETRLVKAKSLLSSIEAQVSSIAPHPDLLLIQADPSVKIKQIRDLQVFLSRKPYQSLVKAVIISEAEKMTLSAQNSFLKTLEEPPAHSQIILCVQNSDQLLPTILSRCQIIKLTSQQDQKFSSSLFTIQYSLFTKIIKSSPGQRLLLIEPYTKSREEAVKFCEEMIIVLRQLLFDKPQRLATIQPARKGYALSVAGGQFNNLTITIKKFQSTLNLINSNVNVKLALDNLVLNLPRS